MPPPLVLIVDDNPENLSVVGELLLPRHGVRVANSGARALQLARMPPQPDLILLDVMMPGMDGFEVLRALRDNPETSDIPVVLLTALDSDEDEERGLVLGAADYLTKPVRPAVLLARVARLLAQRNAQRRQRADLQQLAAELQQQQAALAATREGTLQILLQMQDHRDPESVRHRQHTQTYLRSLCRVLRHHPRFAALMDEREVQLVLRAAPLHDIGLLAVPDPVLQKPGPLDAAERQLMQRHAQIGAEILARLAPAPWLPWARELAQAHHERWDGQGYPGGLAGEAIAWPVRLMSVVDTYDALTTPRPHRQALRHADASDVIASERASQFDPDVVDAFLEVCHDWPAIAQRHG